MIPGKHTTTTFVPGFTCASTSLNFVKKKNVKNIVIKRRKRKLWFTKNRWRVFFAYQMNICTAT